MRRLGTFTFVAALLLSALGLPSLAGCSPAATGGAEGTALRGTLPPTPPPPRAGEARTLRVASFNIHGGKGRDGRRDLARTAALLRDFDVVGLNEVHGGDPDQAERLGRATGMAWLFAPVERMGGRDDFGNGLLSRLPVRHWQRLPISPAGAETHRNIVLARLPVGGRTVNVLVTHLARPGDERPGQLRAVAELFLALQPPAVLMGDLNTRRGDEQLERLLAEAGVVDALGVGDEGVPAPAIDWLLVRGLRVVSSGRRDDGSSDHPLVWAELELEP
jgi:endonuclease/exonuclease/phosphatase family metal-dependent hydrolase